MEANSYPGYTVLPTVRQASKWRSSEIQSLKWDFETRFPVKKDKFGQYKVVCAYVHAYVMIV